MIRDSKSLRSLVICFGMTLGIPAYSATKKSPKPTSKAAPKATATAPKRAPSCETLQWSDRNLAKTSTCIAEMSTKCLATKAEAPCRRTLELKDMYLQLLEQPDLISGKFWRMEAQCRAFSDVREVLEVPIFREKNVSQEWNLRMSRVCRLTSPLSEAVRRFCEDKATPDDMTELKSRLSTIDSNAGREAFCYKSVGGASSQIMDAYCAAGFNQTCWMVFAPTIDPSQPTSTYEAQVKEICRRTPKGACNEAEAFKTFEEFHTKKKKADSDLATETLSFLAEFASTKGKPLALNFETAPKAYDEMISKLTKVTDVISRHAKSQNRNGVIPELFALPLYGQRVRVPVLSCQSPGTSEVPSKKQSSMVRILSYNCSPHNRFRLSITGDPGSLGARLKSLPDPGPNENWLEGTVVGFNGTGVVTELVVAID